MVGFEKKRKEHLHFKSKLYKIKIEAYTNKQKNCKLLFFLFV